MKLKLNNCLLLWSTMEDGHTTHRHTNEHKLFSFLYFAHTNFYIFHILLGICLKSNLNNWFNKI